MPLTDLHDLDDPGFGRVSRVKTHVQEEQIGAILTASDFAELRILRARVRRAEDDMDEFWERVMPGGIPGPAKKHG